MNKAPLNEFVSNLHKLESSFIAAKEANIGIDDSLAFFASNIINQRMFIYNIEKNLLDRIKKTRENSNLITLYTYFNDYLEDNDSPYRDLLRYEIDTLIKGTELSSNTVENLFISEHSSMVTSIFAGVFFNETGETIELHKIPVRQIEDSLLSMNLDRKTCLKFCIAAMSATFDKGNEDKIFAIVGERKIVKFYEFYDTMLSNYSIHDNDSYMLIIFLSVFNYIFDSY